MTVQLSSVDSAYAQRRKQHMALINQLRAIGAQADLDLPRIVVIGNQSAGKSSLVEAISGISVPRDAGTCTRCPMECRLSQTSGEWQCQVSIRWEYQKDGSRYDKVRETPFGELITSKADVELVLRRAQAAVLNACRSASKWVNAGPEDLKKQPRLTFSKNTVCVNIKGPELTDLAFVDLPGIIQNAESETVEFVEELVLSHIRGNCLILVTLPMSDDIENQKAAWLARKEDPEGLRTIGVLTKPDTLPPGATKSRKLWLDVIEGRRAYLKHGYYCTRQPDDDERANQITTQDARDAEQAFFGSTQPWCQSSHPNRFGTVNLVQNVSKHLSRIIDDSLPNLLSEIESQLEHCNSRLSKLPPPITAEPTTHVLTLLTSFCQNVTLNVYGDPEHSELVQASRAIYSNYKREIRSSAPQFLPFVNKGELRGDVAGYLRLDDGESQDNMDDDESGLPTTKYIFLQDVRRRIERSLTRELPNNIPYPVKVSLMQSPRRNWNIDSMNCFEEVHRVLKALVSKLVENQFGRYNKLRDQMRISIHDLLDAKREETLSLIEKMLKWESSPYTQNSHYYQVTKEKYLTKYKAARAGHTIVEPGPAVKRPRLSTNKSRRVVDSMRKKVAPPPEAESSSEDNGRYDDHGEEEDDEEQAQEGYEEEEEEDNGEQEEGDYEEREEGPDEEHCATESGYLPDHSEACSERGTYTNATQSCSVDIINKFGKRSLNDDEREELERKALSALAALGYNVTAADFGKLVPPDLYEQEMDIMAEVRAYFHVAYKRIIDNIPMAIDNTFLFSFAEDLQPFLIEKLGLGTSTGSTRCALYLAEDVAIAAEREELSNKKKRLENIQSEINNFGLA